MKTSLIKRFAKKIILVIETILPRSLSKLIVTAIYKTYRTLMHWTYKLRIIKYKITGNKTMLEMTQRISEVLPYTLVGIGGLEATYQVAKKMNQEGIKGDFVELGVARGGCSALMAGVAFDKNIDVDRKMWLFDSFEGLPEPTQDDFLDGQEDQTTGEHVANLQKGDCLGPLDEVKNLIINQFKFPQEKVNFIKGWFEDTVTKHGKDVGDIAILRIDADWYDSTKVCLDNLFDQVVPGGGIIIDDYGTCHGCKKAVDEFIEHRALPVQLNFDGRGGCYFFKPTAA